MSSNLYSIYTQRANSTEKQLIFPYLILASPSAQMPEATWCLCLILVLLQRFTQKFHSNKIQWNFACVHYKEICSQSSNRTEHLVLCLASTNPLVSTWLFSCGKNVNVTATWRGTCKADEVLSCFLSSDMSSR